MLVLACFSQPPLQVLGVSTVYGNTTVEKTTEHALKVLRTVCGSDIGAVFGWLKPCVEGCQCVLELRRSDVADVVAGAAKPIIRPLKTCPEIHGVSGLDGHEYDARCPCRRTGR
jgi:inosine-uridine nucleoside N-ribohydrolase